MNVDTLLAAMPGLSRARALECLGPCNQAMVRWGMTSRLRAAHWLAQVGHESVSLRYFEEIASGAAYEGRQDLGNVYPGDGRRFKGRGPIQITGRYNYTKAAAALNLDLVGNPALAARIDIGFLVSGWWWWQAGCNQISDRGSDDPTVVALTRRINGGTNGLADRRARFARTWGLGNAVLPSGSPEPSPPKPQGGAMDICPTSSGNGYWIAASDGGVFTFGDAGFFGSLGNVKLAAPIVGMAARPQGDGYWMCGSDGGVFSFGQAPFHGSLAKVTLAKPITGMSAAPDGDGYTLLGRDGGVFNFGSSRFFGSAVGMVRL